MKAAELDESDAMHLIGAWYFDVRNISWIQRKTTILLFGQAPPVTYQEAEPYLFKSHDLDDPLWENDVLLGVMYVHIRRNDEAKKWCHHMMDRTVVTAKEGQLHDVVKTKYNEMRFCLLAPMFVVGTELCLCTAC